MWMPRMLFLSALVVVGAEGAVSIQQGEAPAAVEPTFLSGKALDTFFAEVEKKMGACKSVAATFRQEKTLALFKEPLRSSGQILFSTPDHLRWEFREPFRSVLVVSGDQVAKFEKQPKGWRKLEQGRRAEVILVVMDNIRSWFRGDFDRESGAFVISGAREPWPLIRLRPTDKLLKRSLNEVQLRLSDDLAHVVQVTIREASGDRTVMKFETVERPESQTLPLRYFALDQVLEVKAEDLAVEGGPRAKAGAK